MLSKVKIENFSDFSKNAKTKKSEKEEKRNNCKKEICGIFTKPTVYLTIALVCVIINTVKRGKQELPQIYL